jgi:nucleobase:cation symporter-1, NCS1 family
MTTTAAPAETTRHVEAPVTLNDPPPRVLGFWDQCGLWANLGVSLLAPIGALFVLEPFGYARMSYVGAFVAVVVGTLVGTALLAVATIPGAKTGAPSMVLLRGLFGTRVSYLPTALNVLQLLGWATFEIVTITAAARQLLPWHSVRWPYIVSAGVLTTLMTIRPLGVVRVLRRYALVAVAVATTYLFIELLRHPHPSLTRGSWSGFGVATDVLIAVSVSWVPLASDYSRHSRTVRTAATSAFVGYAVAQIVYYTLGLVALATVVHSSSPTQHDMFAAFIAVPVGWLAFAVLTARELDESFADSYSTVLSIQNVVPWFDRRILAVCVGAIATLGALVIQIGDYQNFLYLLGSVFVPLFAVFAIDYFVFGGARSWALDVDAPPRWRMLVPWLVGFAMYQLVSPPDVGGWATWWARVDSWLHFTKQSWMSASVLSFLAAAVITGLVAALPGARRAD